MTGDNLADFPDKEVMYLNEPYGRHPKKHNISLTYEPKVDAVRDGRCTQTIRTGHKFSEGDLVRFHGWEGRPYRSKWAWRTPYFRVVDVLNVYLTYSGMMETIGSPSSLIPWDSPEMDLIAAEDFIDPPTGQALRDVLVRLNGIEVIWSLPAQIIRWKWRREEM